MSSAQEKKKGGRTQKSAPLIFMWNASVEPVMSKAVCCAEERTNIAIDSRARW